MIFVSVFIIKKLYICVIKHQGMKSKIGSIVFLLLGCFVWAQSNNNHFGIQTGYLGVYAYNESKLYNQIVLRSEVGFDAALVLNADYSSNNLVFVPKIQLEPRYYYNLNSRLGKGKNVKNNGADFVSINISHHPDWFNLFGEEDFEVIKDLSIVPTWGMKRNISKHLNYELGGGFGYYQAFTKEKGAQKNKTKLVANLLLRIGYVF